MVSTIMSVQYSSLNCIMIYMVWVLIGEFLTLWVECSINQVHFSLSETFVATHACALTEHMQGCVESVFLGFSSLHFITMYRVPCEHALNMWRLETSVLQTLYLHAFSE